MTTVEHYGWRGLDELAVAVLGPRSIGGWSIGTTYGGTHAGRGTSWSSGHYADSCEPGPPWRNGGGTDGCGRDYGIGGADLGALRDLFLTPAVRKFIREMILDHTYWRYGVPRRYAPTDHTGSNRHLHVVVDPCVLLPIPGRPTPPDSELGDNPVMALEIGFATFAPRHAPGKRIDIPLPGFNASGTQVEIFDANNGDNQQFAWYEVGRTPDGTLVAQIVSKGSPGRFPGRVLDVFHGRIEPGTPVITWPSHGGPNQRWIVEDFDGGKRYRMERAPGLVLAVANAATANKTPLILANANGAPDQTFDVR